MGTLRQYFDEWLKTVESSVTVRNSSGHIL